LEFSGDREPSGAGRGGSPPESPVVIASPAELGAAGHHQTAQCGTRHACRTCEPDGGTVRDVWSLPCRAESLAGLVAVVSIGATLTGCGSGDSTVAKTPQGTSSIGTTWTATAGAASPPSATAAPPSGSAPPADPCAVNLASPTIVKVVTELPRDPRSSQPWNPEPVAGNYNQCAQLSAVIIKANTNADNPTTRAVMFHLGQFIPQGVPDTYGFNSIDMSQSTGDTVALTYPSSINGLNTDVRFHWNGNGVEIIGKAAGR
jgi:hypothetical protein